MATPESRNIYYYLVSVCACVKFSPRSASPLAVAEMNADKLIKFSWAHYNLLGPGSLGLDLAWRAGLPTKEKWGGGDYKTIH